MGHFSPRAFAAAMSLTVTRPGRRPPYSGSDLPAAPAMDAGCAFAEDCAMDDDIVRTSKVSRRPTGVPGHFDNGTPEAWQDIRVPSDFAPSAAAGATPLAISFAAADEIVRRFHERGGQPAISYGIAVGGELVHAAGFGGPPPGGPAP